MFAQTRQIFHVPFPALDFFIEDHAVEAFPALEEFAGKIEMTPSNKPETVKMLLHHGFSLLNALRDFDLLVAGQQRHLPHLLQIHPYRVIQDINLCWHPAFLFVLLIINVFLAVPVAIHFGRFDDIDLQATQTRENQIQFVGVGNAFGQGFVQIVEREMALFLCQLDKFPNARLNFDGRIQTGNAESRHR